MLDRVTLRTKFVALIVVVLVTIAAVAVPSILDHARQRDAAVRSADRVRIAASLGEFLDRLGREATLTSWFVTSGEPTVRAELAAARPLTDRSARVIDSHRSAEPRTAPIRGALRAVSAQWAALRTARARFDRRLASDDQVLVQFDRSASRVVEAFDALAMEPSGLASTDARHDPARALHARAQLAALERNAIASQAAVLTAVVRHEVSPTLMRRLRAIADRQTAAPDPIVIGAGSPIGLAKGARHEFRSRAGTSAAYRAPTLSGRLPFATATDWRRVSGLEIDSIQQIGRAVDRSGTTTATRGVERARSTLVRTALLLALCALILILATCLLLRSVRRAIRSVTGPVDTIPTGPAAATLEATAAAVATDEAPEPPIAQPEMPPTPAVTVPPLPRRTREPGSPEPGIPLVVPGRRTPDEAFELVARYEAGLRRARSAPDHEPDSETPQ